MPLDTNIALGVQPLKLDNPMNAMIGLSQLEHAKNQNALAQYQISSAQRADQQQKDFLEAASQPGFKLDVMSAIKGGPTALAAYKAQQDAFTNNLTNTKLQGEINKNTFDLKEKELTKAMMMIANLNNPEQALAGINQSLSKGDIDKTKADQMIQHLNSVPFAEFKSNFLKGLTTAHEQMLDERSKSNNDATNATAAAGHLMTDTRLREQFKQTQGLAREKFTWEKANPGYELKENDKGEIVGVNKKTLQSFPVTIGNPQQNTAPNTAASMAPGAAAPVAGAPGSPLIGKGTALTDSQGNAAAYGMRMREANDLMNKLESSGTKNTGIIKNTIGSVVGVFPFIGDKLTEGVGSMMNPLPGLLGGPNSEQQQLDAARRNFVTAVLRKESGAAISPSEFANEEKKYFPQVGDTDAVLKQKQKSRELAIKAMSIQAGPGAKYIPGAQGSMSGSDPLGLFK